MDAVYTSDLSNWVIEDALTVVHLPLWDCWVLLADIFFPYLGTNFLGIPRRSVGCAKRYGHGLLRCDPGTGDDVECEEDEGANKATLADR